MTTVEIDVDELERTREERFRTHIESRGVSYIDILRAIKNEEGLATAAYLLGSLTAIQTLQPGLRDEVAQRMAGRGADLDETDRAKLSDLRNQLPAESPLRDLLPDG